MCKEGRTTRMINDEKGGQHAERARPTIENEKQDPFQFASV